MLGLERLKRFQFEDWALVTFVVILVIYGAISFLNRS